MALLHANMPANCRGPLILSSRALCLALELEWHRWKGPGLLKAGATEGEPRRPPWRCRWLLWDKKFRKWVDLYAKDEQAFFDDFAAVRRGTGV